MDQIDAMQRFVLVAHTRSFTKAAETLGLPKSSISASVQDLEKQLGVRLFHRSTRSVTLTQDGETYLPQCQTLLAEVDALNSQFQRNPDDIRGTLRIDMPSRFAATVVIPHLSRFLATYPNLRLKISSADYRVDPVKEGLDCVIRVGELTNSDLIARPLTLYRSINCVSAEYVAQYGMPTTLADLAHHRLIEYSHTLGNVEAHFEYMEGDQVKQLAMPSRIAVNGTEAYLNACLSGLGIAQIPVIGVEALIEEKRLIPVLTQYEAQPMPVSLLYPSRRLPPKRLIIFMDWLHALVLSKEK
ncbi:LysR family transcriptional regulator [Marinomonas sp. IMCC 4694]|uniref:LysR family transcriptional regulator n=1 Tax=Marinomonas sp. IMCC 4694 TaxID=2605432 RepID=UPI0011E79B74|nr:LysR family transcriptional regulator [Marinomonas sp. IMCC 4694]TYL48893.1 LysR family transcriptional regulator [Marinomonas sp. IMCC 4694]